MLSREEFDLIQELMKTGSANQRNLSKALGFSLGKVNSLLQGMRKSGLISENGSITEQGLSELKPHQVENAIIMAAGMSSRFAPLSYEKPKGTLVVKGEVLIERQIRQLQEAGINNITVVVGYMKEKFFYLQEKFGVKILVNEDYYRYNNPSTLIRVLDQLGNTYICSSDNYFVENVFEKYVYDSYYSAVFFEGSCNEYGLSTDKKGRIKAINHSPKDMWIMMGHVYFSKSFSKVFSEILVKEFDQDQTKKELWENLLERHLDELPIYIRKYDNDKILEFDSLEELRSFDSRYLENSNSRIFQNICQVLNCKECDIGEIHVIKQGLTNLSFRFSVAGKEYIYRHPGIGTEAYISRESEAFSMEVAKELKLDRTIIAINGKEGWKISKYISNARTLNYHNEKEVKKALALMRTLHDSGKKSKYDFDIWARTCNLIQKTTPSHKDFEDFDFLQSEMTRLYDYVKKDRVPWILCHCDCYDPNFLLDENDEMTLIDWEYSGNDDPANDLGTFICCSDYSFEEALNIFRMYYNREPSEKELRHNLAYVAIASYYWFIWAIYQESIGNTIGQYLFLWYQNTKEYMRKALKLYEREE